MEIELDDVFGMDWDWFATDTGGNIGHFTTAGMRPLPNSVRCSKERLDLLYEYFRERAAVRGRSLLTPGLENKRGAFKKLLDWSSFLDMAARGLYSYNTELDHGPDAQYYLVARPERPISIEDLPADVRDALQLTILAVSFPETTRIPEVQTL